MSDVNNNNNNKDNYTSFKINDDVEIFAPKKVEIYKFGLYTFYNKNDYLNFMKTFKYKD
jgi:hypothetical protein